MKTIGKGQISLNLNARGELRVIKTIHDVIKLMKEGADGKIAMVEDAGTTTLGPIISKLAGVVCLSGGLGSHLAIVTREFSIPALMGTKLESTDKLDRKQVEIKPSGSKSGILVLWE